LFLTALMVFGVALYLAFGQKPTATVVQASSTPNEPAATPDAPVPAPATAAPPEPPAAAQNPTVADPQPVATTSATAVPTASQAAEPQAVTEAATPAPAPAPVAPPPPPKRVNRPEPIVLAWVEKIQITGVRRSGRPKVLMNDRVYTIGDTVNFEYDLKLAAVGERTLTFEDPLGNTYDLRF
jgi:hypothetical protein